MQKNVVWRVQQGRGNCCIMSLCNKFGNGLAGLNHVVFCIPDFIWVKRADKIVQMPQTWFSEITQTTWLKKTTWVGTESSLAFVYLLQMSKDLCETSYKVGSKI